MNKYLIFILINSRWEIEKNECAEKELKKVLKIVTSCHKPHFDDQRTGVGLDISGAPTDMVQKILNKAYRFFKYPYLYPDYPSVSPVTLDDLLSIGPDFISEYARPYPSGVFPFVYAATYIPVFDTIVQWMSLGKVDFRKEGIIVQTIVCHPDTYRKFWEAVVFGSDFSNDEVTPQKKLPEHRSDEGEEV